MKTYYVYILKCSDDSLYVGVTNDLSKRISEHQLGLDSESYTYLKRPVKLIYHAIFNDIEAAISFEKQLKGWSRKKKLALVNNDWDKVSRLAKRRTPDKARE